jgi:hypothetical protein
MKRNPTLIGFLCGVVVALIAIWMSVSSAAGGHGQYVAARAWFPFTMASTYFYSAVSVPFLALAVAQLPIYGWLAGRAASKTTPGWILWVIGSVHAALVVLLFLRPPESLS